MADSCTETFFTKPCTTGYEEVASSGVAIVTGVGITVTGAERIVTKDWAITEPILDGHRTVLAAAAAFR